MKKVLFIVFLVATSISAMFLAGKNAIASQPSNCVGEACNSLDQGSEQGEAFGQVTWFITFQNLTPNRTIRIYYRQAFGLGQCMSESYTDVQPGRKVALLSYCSPIKANFIN